MAWVFIPLKTPNAGYIVTGKVINR